VTQIDCTAPVHWPDANLFAGSKVLFPGTHFGAAREFAAIPVFLCLDRHRVLPASTVRSMKKNVQQQHQLALVKSRTTYFLVQVLCIMICGSYLNLVLVGGSWLMVLFKIRDHNILLTVAFAVSVVLQTYQLSIDSRHVLFASSQPQTTCSISGITTLENFAAETHMFSRCDTGRFVPFQAQDSYALVLEPSTKLVYRYSEADADMHVGTCEHLGVLCYAWKVRVHEFGARTFEPCWKLVQNIYAVNVSQLVMYNTIQTGQKKHYQRQITSNYSNMHMWFSSDAKVPLDLIDTAHQDTKEIDKIGDHSPDLSTIFVLVPTREARFSRMHLSLSSKCQHSDAAHSHVPQHTPTSAINTGIVSIAKVARPALFTLHAIFSECTRGCGSGTVVSVGVLALNFLICTLCLLAVHGDTSTVNLFSGLFVFSLSTSIITLNWVAVLCIVVCYLMTTRNVRRTLYVLHTVQFICIARELFNNRLGTNSTYILSTPHRRESPLFVVCAIFVPFIAIDQNLYLQNCALYLSMHLFCTYLFYFKSRGISTLPLVYALRNALSTLGAVCTRTTVPNARH